MISYTVVLQPGAGEDVDNAYEWYEYQQSGLGSLFLNELESFYHKLEFNPQVFGKLTNRYRQAVLKRFPYVIIFEIIRKEVHIYSVFHTSRNPKHKMKQ